MRILISTHHNQDPHSGASGTGLALGDAYAELGNEVDYLSFDEMPELPERLAALAYPPFVATQLSRRRYRGVDVVDASTGDTWIWGSLHRRRRRPLLVTRSHGLEHLFDEHTVEHERRHGRSLSRRHRLYWGGYRLAEVRRSLRRADLVLCLNERERAYAEQRLGVDPRRIEVVANGIDTRFLAAAGAANPSAGARRIAHVGAYREMKGVDYACEALTAVLERVPDLSASFFGAGVPREQLLDHFPPALHERIETRDNYQRQELPGLLEGHGILLFPSLSEGFGNALAEAMACGLAPVAARSAGAEQIVADGESGLLVPRYDAAALTAATLRLLDSPPLLEQLQVGARRRAESFALRDVSARTLELYRRGLERRERGERP